MFLILLWWDGKYVKRFQRHANARDFHDTHTQTHKQLLRIELKREINKSETENQRHVNVSFILLRVMFLFRIRKVCANRDTPSSVSLAQTDTHSHTESLVVCFENIRNFS